MVGTLVVKGLKSCGTRLDFFFTEIKQDQKTVFKLSYFNISFQLHYLNINLSLNFDVAMLKIYHPKMSLITRGFILQTDLKVHLCKLYNNKYMIASAQITNTEIFAYIAVLVLSH